MLGTSTRAPSGSADATSATSPDTWLPIVTPAGSAPTRRANECRARSTDSSQTARRVRPVRQPRMAWSSSRSVGCGGSPYVAVSR